MTGIADLNREVFHRTQAHPSHQPEVMTILISSLAIQAAWQRA